MKSSPIDSDKPQTLQEAIKYFGQGDRAFEYLKGIRWPDGRVICPRCESDEVSFVSTRKLWTCSQCKTKKQFTLRIGTILEDSAIPYEKWLCAFWLISNAKNGVSSHEVGRSLGVTQRTGWFMLQRIRLAMQNGSIVKLSGEVEVDETFIGGAARFMHKTRRKEKGIKTGPLHLTPVQGLLQRHAGGKSRVILKVMKNRREIEATKHVKEYVLKNSNVYTDKLASYQHLGALDYAHRVIDHAERYVDGVVHTNGLENFWCLLKRTIKGTYVGIEPFHLFRYLDEQAFRFNERGDNDSGRFDKALAGIIGKRLTFDQVRGRTKEGG